VPWLLATATGTDAAVIRRLLAPAALRIDRKPANTGEAHDARAEPSVAGA
jgi:hypothetical protein